ncbi:unnamed protein product [Pleuronectes platessa]|uniref:Saposin B-type domain-containing protein n=1 Tax=Pleuronectes platessa TaxID=8262 RepID=A0A9N7VDZ6_PLEPL|nr:unnamed protein product [Pleuronectes platessa]
MAALQFMLFLFIGLQSFALNADALQRVPDAMRATGDVCKDCTQMFELLEDLLSSADLQKKMIDGIETLCDHLPGPPSMATLCKKEVEKMLPLAFTFITGMIKPAEVCKLIGLCGSSCDRREKMLSYFAEQALQAAVTSQNGRPTSACSFCLFLLKTLEDLLPMERTEAEVVKLLDEILRVAGRCRGSLRPMHCDDIQVQRRLDCPQMWNSVLLPEICLEAARQQHALKCEDGTEI